MISSFKKYIHTIKGRLFLTHICIAFLMTPVLLYAYVSVQMISDARSKREQLTHFNIGRLKSSDHFAMMLDYDVKTDSFYLGLETVNVKRYRAHMSKSRSILQTLRDGDDVGSHVYTRRLEKTMDYLNSLDRNINKVIELKKVRGFKDYGYIGDMRDHIHRLEEDSTLQLGLAEILSLRRREKDFFLRADPKYVRLLNHESEALLNRLKPDTLYLRTRQELIAYRVLFNEIVRIDEQIGNTNSGLIREIYEASQSLENEYNALFDVISAHSSNLVERVTIYITAFFLLTVLTASVLAFYISGKISIPLNSLVRNMQQLRSSRFDNEEPIKVDTSIRELLLLSDSYSDLMHKLKDQLGHLETKNRQLNELNLQLKTSERELKEASQVKDKFFSIISHDLRGHAGNIGSLSGVLADQEKELQPEQRSVFINHLKASSQNMTLLLENLLNWAKSQMNNHQLVKKSFDIVEVIEKNLSLYRETASQKGIRFQFEPGELPNVYADKDMLDFAIRNLLSNSIKFSRSGDEISVELLAIQESIQVKIRDTGIGMTSDQVRALENRQGESISRSGTGKEKGTGLGFATTQDFIKRNGGRIKIYSEVNKGSTIIFTVPTSLTKESILKVN